MRTGSLLHALLAAFVLACGPEAEPARGAAPVASVPAETRPAVLFLGTSLTAGLGVPSDQAFPALIQERTAVAGLPYRVVNAGVSGDTSAGGLRRIDWLLRRSSTGRLRGMPRRGS
jgi:acyl-CoA thioesterase-1